MKSEATLALVLIVAATLASAQKNDWENVRALSPGDIISVKADGRSAKCLFQAASEDTLVCALRHAPKHGSAEIVLAKAAVREINLQRGGSTGRDIAGVAAFAVAAGSPLGPTVVVPMLAAVGAGKAGEAVGTHIPLVSGKLVYRRR
jgi:hypothetical protein